MPVPASPTPPPSEALLVGPNLLLDQGLPMSPAPPASAPPPSPRSTIARHPRHPSSQWHPFFSPLIIHEHKPHQSSLETFPLTPHSPHFPPSLIISYLQNCSPDRPLLPPLLPPDYKPEIRPHYPGGWGSGVGSQANPADTLAVSRRRGRSGPVASYTCEIVACLRDCLRGCLAACLV